MRTAIVILVVALPIVVGLIGYGLYLTGGAEIEPR
jgi:hypothetical protein